MVLGKDSGTTDLGRLGVVTPVLDHKQAVAKAGALDFVGLAVAGSALGVALPNKVLVNILATTMHIQRARFSLRQQTNVGFRAGITQYLAASGVGHGRDDLAEGAASCANGTQEGRPTSRRLGGVGIRHGDGLSSVQDRSDGWKDLCFSPTRADACLQISQFLTS